MEGLWGAHSPLDCAQQCRVQGLQPTNAHRDHVAMVTLFLHTYYMKGSASVFRVREPSTWPGPAWKGGSYWSLGLLENTVAGL